MVALYLPSLGTNLTVLTANLRTPSPATGVLTTAHPFLPRPVFLELSKLNCTVLPTSRLCVSSLLSEIQISFTGSHRSPLSYLCALWLHLLSPSFHWSSFTLYPVLLGPSEIKVLEHVTHRKGSNSNASQNNRNEY